MRLGVIATICGVVLWCGMATAQLDCPIDICVVIDGSDSVTNNRFARVRSTLLLWLEATVIGNRNVRWSYNTFSDNIDSFIEFSGNENALRGQITSVLARGGGRTFTNFGIQDCTDRKEAIDPNFDRDFLVILITDGNSNQPGSTAAQIQRVISLGVRCNIFVVTIGDIDDYDDIEEYHRQLGDDWTEHVDDFQALQDRADEIIGQFTCERCGDGDVTIGEQCDDGNTINGDGCSSTCLIEVVVGPCDGCKIINGVGFNPSFNPPNCGCFLTCLFSADGGQLITFIERPCEPLFWDQDLLTCVPVNQTSCPDDPCRSRNIDFWPMKCCMGYWVCGDGMTISPAWCEEQERWDQQQERCVSDNSCTDRCDPPEPWTCHLLSNDNDPSDRTYYAQQDIGDGTMERILMNCPINTAFNQNDCGCTDYTNDVPVCNVDLRTSYLNRMIEDSANEAYIRNEKVQLDGALSYAIFDENEGTKLIIPRYANMDWRDEWGIKIEFDGEGNPNRNGPLFSNSGCVDGWSIEIRLERGQGNSPIVRAYVNTRDGNYQLELSYRPNQRQTVYLQYLDGVITFVINYQNGQQEIDSVSASGWVIKRHCAVQIGYGFNGRHYTGNIYLAEIWLCVPVDFLP